MSLLIAAFLNRPKQLAACAIKIVYGRLGTLTRSQNHNSGHRLGLTPSIVRRPLLFPPLIRKSHSGRYGYSRSPQQEFVSRLLIAHDALN
ncbi:hypothetical protein, partial [Mesorhizobium sp.]|uniref:hypothetical protein n=1 Tax=Mesorhizobium sp. TaxID=1871066 RepID=UPI00257A7619